MQFGCRTSLNCTFIITTNQRADESADMEECATPLLLRVSRYPAYIPQRSVPHVYCIHTVRVLYSVRVLQASLGYTVFVYSSGQQNRNNMMLGNFLMFLFKKHFNKLFAFFASILYFKHCTEHSLLNFYLIFIFIFNDRYVT